MFRDELSEALLISQLTHLPILFRNSGELYPIVAICLGLLHGFYMGNRTVICKRP